MANAKTFTLDYGSGGYTVYGIIIREADSYQLNDATGGFASSPADPYISFSEHAIISGRYSLSESRTAWNDGAYTIGIYLQAAGAPNPSVDSLIDLQYAAIYNDEIYATAIYPSLTGGIKLQSLISRYRRTLDDETEPYLWSNQELTDYLNETMNEFCREIPCIEDILTPQVCQISVAVGDSNFTLHSRITILKKARLSSQSKPIEIRTAEWMDANYIGWQSAANGTPQILIGEGIGTGKVGLYPPADTADRINLAVYRLQLVDMLYALDYNKQPELPAIFHDKFANGVLMRAYGKQDVDTYDPKKVATHSALWEKDKESIKRAQIKSRQRPEIAGPHYGMI